MTLFAQSGATIGAIVVAMALVAWIETVIPLHGGERAGRDHLGTNLALTLMTFATNVFLNLGLVTVLMLLPRYGLGLLNLFPQPWWITAAATVLGLDFAFYVAHVAMHKFPALWKYHVVHHSDAFVDVSTSLRQHPGEGVIRYAFMAAFALPLGAAPAAFAVYRTWSALWAIPEHANLRLPPWLDRMISLVSASPNTHKVHHSRQQHETDTNYGNIFTFWDRLFSTFTPSERGADIRYGLDGFDGRDTQTVAGLLWLPFRDPKAQEGMTREECG